MPSQRLFRAATIVLAVGAVLGLWFLIGTPRLPGETARASTRLAAGPLAGAEKTTPAPSPSAASLTPGPTTTPAPRDYVVKAGDTIESIASASGVTADTIRQLNPGVDPIALQIGQTIHLRDAR